MTAAPGSGGPPLTLTYAAAGVDVEAGDKAVELMKAAVRTTHRPEVLGGLGGFAGLFDASAIARMARPVLATSTDGVGTKVAIAQAMDVHHTIGFDLVGMVVDDVVVCGAEPLFMTDYIATGKVVPERIAAIVEGIAAACRQAGVALVGGETAEHPGLLEPHEYDLAGAATGVVEHARLLGPHRVQAGDAVVALASSGLHANGYSLVRAVFRDAGWGLDRHVPELGRSLGEELLEPTRVYAADLLALLAGDGPGDGPGGVVGDGTGDGPGDGSGGVLGVARLDVHALSHVTGGGLAANLARVLPPGLDARLDRGSWTPAPIFGLVRDLGRVPQSDLERTLNLGVGFAVVLPADQADRAVRACQARGIPAWQLGEVTPASGAGEDDGAEVVRSGKGASGGSVRVYGTHPR